MLKRLGLLVVPAMMVAAIALLPSGAASGDLICPPGQTNTNYCVRKCVVPKVTGKKLSVAKQLLAAHDCTVGKIRRKESDKDRKGHHQKDKKEKKKEKKQNKVKKQSPSPGSQLAADAAVNLRVGG